MVGRSEAELISYVTSLDTAGVDGQLEPKRPPKPPYEYDAAADIVIGADYLWELDERGLPPGFPAGFPIPEEATCVLAQRAYDGTWEHAAWRRERPFEEYLPFRLLASLRIRSWAS